MARKPERQLGFDPYTAQAGDACSELDCESTTAFPCQYVDRRGRACDTSWCTIHRRVVEGRVYCPRHAGIVGAVGSDSSSMRPDLESRCASLVNWIANAIDGDVKQILETLPDRREDERMLVEPVRLVFGVHAHERRWERGWKLLDHVAVTTRVTLEVSEHADTEVRVRINGNDVVTVVPPWIEHRQRSEWLAPLEDRLERSYFDQYLVARIREGVLASRHRDTQLVVPRMPDAAAPPAGPPPAERPSEPPAAAE